MKYNMHKITDRLSPICPNPYSLMEQWGGTSWFPPEKEKMEKPSVKEIQKENNK